MRSLIATIGLDVALSIGDLPRAIRYGLYVAAMLSFEHAERPPGFGAFVLDHQVGKVAAMAAGIQVGDFTPPLADEVARTIAEYDGPRNDATNALMTALRAISTATLTGDTTQLEEAYDVAVASDCREIARDVAWYWSFRCLRKKTTPPEFLLWQWHLTWLSLEVSGTNAQFMASFLAQERDFLSRCSDSTRILFRQLFSNCCTYENLTQENSQDGFPIRSLVLCFRRAAHAHGLAKSVIGYGWRKI